MKMESLFGHQENEPKRTQTTEIYDARATGPRSQAKSALCPLLASCPTCLSYQLAAHLKTFFYETNPNLLDDQRAQTPE
ncbi:MAG: hypothetical protein ACYTEX_22885 [Planctomycetota bacterium]|jgi:hypothetical protein